MVTLDGDVIPLYSKNLNKYIERDMVQFVPYREALNDPIKFAEKLLEEIPH